MFDMNKIEYLTQAGVLFLVFLFTMIIYFFAVSPVVDGFFNAFINVEAGLATDEIQYFGPLLYEACKIILAVCVAIPMVWFIFWALSRQTLTSRRKF